MSENPDENVSEPRVSHEEAVMERLRIDQILRAVRVAAGFGMCPQVQVRSGQIMDDDEPGGMDARIIDAHDQGEQTLEEQTLSAGPE